MKKLHWYFEVDICGCCASGLLSVNELVPRSKNELTTTLPIIFFFEMSAAFEFFVSSSNYGFIG